MQTTQITHYLHHYAFATTLFKAKFIFKSHSHRQICIINTVTAKKVNHEVDPLLGPNSHTVELFTQVGLKKSLAWFNLSVDLISEKQTKNNP